MPAGFFQFKVTLFSFGINKYLAKRYFETMLISCNSWNFYSVLAFIDASYLISCRLSIPNLKGWKPKCSKFKTFWVPQLEDFPPDLMWWVAVKTNTLKMLYKLIFRQCVWGEYEAQMNFMFILGFHPQDILLYVCRYSNSPILIWNPKCFFSQAMFLYPLDKGYSTCITVMMVVKWWFSNSTVFAYIY